jgi:Ca-activated chloride channel family protein
VEAPFHTEAYDKLADNPFVRVADEPLSTFSIDVDTASYSNVRRFLEAGNRPPADAVRVEELVNYFPYEYAPPAGSDPFAVDLAVSVCPWKAEHRLVRIGMKGREMPKSERPAGNLVFLIDVSGSMQDAQKLPLVKQSLRMLLGELTAKDHVAMVVYAGAAGLVLEPTAGDRGVEIAAALDRLEAGGSTNGAQGIELAYATAARGFVRGGINRVILATDGDFNVGVTSEGDLVRLIEAKAKEGVFLTVLGFGMGNLKDATLEKLADRGNGSYAYIDTPLEARKVLVEQAGGTLVTIAKDVKIQVEFNPSEASAYRLIGYENRLLAKQDFNDDKKDAGEIGAGHTVTALYEVVPAGVAMPLPAVDPLRYQGGATTSPQAGSGELLTVKVRFKDPEGDQSRLLSFPLAHRSLPLEQASEDFRFAASVAAFGMLLRDSEHRGDASFAAVLDMAGGAVGRDPGGYRTAFLDLVRRARTLPAKDR